MRRVVITGMGIYSCIGKNLEAVKTSLYEGNQVLSLIRHGLILVFDPP